MATLQEVKDQAQALVDAINSVQDNSTVIPAVGSEINEVDIPMPDGTVKTFVPKQ